MCQGWRCYLAIVLIGGLAAGCRSSSRDVAPPLASAPVAPSLEPVRTVRRPRELAPNVFPVERVSYDEPDDLPSPDESSTAPPVPEVIAHDGPLQLVDVVLSVQESYPLLITAMLERDIVEGRQLSARGEFDTDVKAFGVAAPEGFYQTYRNGVAVDQPLFRGGYVYGGYKIGDGNFQPWFKERETNEGGEFSAGLGVPLLKDRTIDKRRAALFQANLARQAVEPAVQAHLLEFVRVASQAYWSWVSAGRSLEAQRELLRNAEARVRQIDEKVNAGDLPRIVRINNEQLIAARETKVIESERKLQEAAIKLSLFFRSAGGEPVVLDDTRLPSTFPDPVAPNSEQIEEDIAMAIAASPALIELDLIAEQVDVELQNAHNMLLPKLDARVLASKDVGAPTSSTGDKTPFELEAGLYGEIPLQRRRARGKIAAAEGKLAQIAAKRQFVVNKVTAAVQDAVSALEAAAGRIERAETNLRLARETLELGRFQFDEGNIDLVTLTIYEKSVTDAELLLISAQADFFSALANYRAALAQDPLAEEQLPQSP